MYQLYGQLELFLLVFIRNFGSEGRKMLQKQLNFSRETLNVTFYETAFSFLALPFEASLIQIELGQVGVSGFFEAFVSVQFR